MDRAGPDANPALVAGAVLVLGRWNGLTGADVQRCMAPRAKHLLGLGKLVLVLVTLLGLSSVGGAMLYACPLLMALHWIAARDSGPIAVGGWALLAALSALEGSWMLSYLVAGRSALSLSVALVGATGVSALFLLRAADRATGRAAAG